MAESPQNLNNLGLGDRPKIRLQKANQNLEFDSKSLTEKKLFMEKVEKKTVNFEELSDEMLLLIMGHLSTSDILRQMGSVCKRFYRLSREQNLIKQIVIIVSFTSLQFEKKEENIS